MYLQTGTSGRTASFLSSLYIKAMDHRRSAETIVLLYIVQCSSVCLAMSFVILGRIIQISSGQSLQTTKSGFTTNRSIIDTILAL